MTRRRTRLRVTVVVVVLLIAGLAVVCALAIHNARSAAAELGAARSVLSGAQDRTDLASSAAAVRQARRHVERAEQHLSGPTLSIARWVPVAGRSVLAGRAVTRAAGSSLAGVALLADAAPDLRVPGGIDVERLQELSEDLTPLAARAEQDVEALDGLMTDWTPAQVSNAVADSEERLEPVVRGLRQAALGSDLAAGLLGAERRRNLLVALGNNAELRGTGGYVSTYATGVIEDGRLRLAPFQDVADVADTPRQARALPAPPEFVEDFGPFLADTTLWREWTMSPDVPDAASVGARVAGELLGVTPDVVLMLDVPALTGIVRLAGSGEVVLSDGTRVPADRLTDALLVDSYAQAGTGPSDQIARRAALRAAAGSTAAQLLTGDVAPLPLVRELGRLARGRHLALWSADALEQQELERLDLAGSADPRGDDLALISVNNLNANKLDYYLDRRVTVQAVVGLERAEVLQRVLLSNRAPEDLVPYVAGSEQPGTVVERVEFSLSPRADLLSATADGEPARGGVRRGVERTRVHTYIELARGQSTELEIRYTVPVRDGRYRLRLLPQPLAMNAALRLSVAPAQDLSMRRTSGSDGGPVQRSAPWALAELVDVTVR